MSFNTDEKRNFSFDFLCDKNCVCCENNGISCCEVEYCVNNEILFVRKKQSTICPHMLSFGLSFICTCKHRKEIFLKLGK